mmetsp:Transcript_52079/g.166067  ORF Transcript_52079/g.166067 Transcript_52079/m.166067 type:complete len:278 (-) Transcript_52079:117-950(-)
MDRLHAPRPRRTALVHVYAAAGRRQNVRRALRQRLGRQGKVDCGPHGCPIEVDDHPHGPELHHDQHLLGGGQRPQQRLQPAAVLRVYRDHLLRPEACEEVAKVGGDDEHPVYPAHRQHGLSHIVLLHLHRLLGGPAHVHAGGADLVQRHLLLGRHCKACPPGRRDTDIVRYQGHALGPRDGLGLQRVVMQADLPIREGRDPPRGVQRDQLLHRLPRHFPLGHQGCLDGRLAELPGAVNEPVLQDLAVRGTAVEPLPPRGEADAHGGRTRRISADISH